MSKYLGVIFLAVALLGCGSKEETVDVPDSATKGGNVVTDPEMKKLTGESDQGGAGESGNLGG